MAERDAHWLDTFRIYVRLALGLALLGTVLVFASQNAGVVGVRFLGWSAEMSLALLLFFALALGVAAGSLLTGWHHWRRGRQRARRSKEEAPRDTGEAPRDALKERRPGVRSPG